MTSEQQATDKSLTSVTFNGSEAFTEIQESGLVSESFYAAVWYLPNPSDVTAPVVYNHVQAAWSTVTVISLSGVEPTIPTVKDSDNCEACPNNTVSINLQTIVENTLLLTCAHSNNSSHTHTQRAGQIERSEVGFVNSHVHSTSTELRGSIGIELLETTAVGSAPVTMRYVAIGVGPFSGVVSQSRRRGGPWVLN